MTDKFELLITYFNYSIFNDSKINPVDSNFPFSITQYLAVSVTFHISWSQPDLSAVALAGHLNHEI